MFQSARTQSLGISVLEVLIALGVVAVICSFASTSFSQASNRAALQVTAEEVQFSIQGARSTARELETEVIVQLRTDPHESQNSISFSLPNRNPELGSSPLLQEYLLPADVRLVASESSIHFDNRGISPAPVELKLVSTLDPNMSESVLVQ